VHQQQAVQEILRKHSTALIQNLLHASGSQSRIAWDVQHPSQIGMKAAWSEWVFVMCGIEACQIMFAALHEKVDLAGNFGAHRMQTTQRPALILQQEDGILRTQMVQADVQIATRNNTRFANELLEGKVSDAFVIQTAGENMSLEERASPRERSQEHLHGHSKTLHKHDALDHNVKIPCA
jgi:hypothetical protein